MQGDNISTVGITSVLWRVFSAVEGYLQYCGGITAVHVGDSFSTVGNTFSTVEVVQYSERITSAQQGMLQYCGGYSVHWGITSVQWGITSVLWRVFSTVGDTFSTVGDNIRTVEVAQYSGDKDLKYYEFSKNLEIFSRAYFASKSDWPHQRTQLLTMADMVKDLGYKNLVLGKILL